MKDSCAFKHVRTQKDLIWVAVEGSYKLQSISLRRENHTRQTPVIVKLLSHKSKMKILLKRKMLKGKGLVIAEDMADDIAKRLKELKRKRSVESSWFSNGKIRYKQRDDPRVKEIRSWRDIANIE